MQFTFEEKSLMWIYNTDNRQQMIDDIRAGLPHVYDAELRGIMETVIGKLEGITDEAFAALDFAPDADFDYQDGQEE